MAAATGVAAGGAAAAVDAIVSTPNKNDEKKLKLLAKQVLGLSQHEVESGDYSADQIMVEALITSIRSDRTVVKDLWGKAEQQKQGRVVSGTEGVEVFKCSTLKGLPPDWKFGWLVKHGDFSGEELILAQEKFSEAVDVLLEYASQLGLHLKIPDDCKYEPVVELLLNQRYAMWGKRLKEFKAKGGVAEDGSLNFKAMAYKPVFNEQGNLQRIYHCSGHRCDIEKVFGDNIDNNYQLKDNYNDHGAAFVLEPFPPIPVIGFFKKHLEEKVGPHAGVRFIDKHSQKRFSACLEDIKKHGLSPGCSCLIQVSMKICAHH